MSSLGCWGLPAALLALLCCPGSGEKTFEVHTWPEKLVVEARGSIEVNCSTSCAKPEKSGLETPLNKTLLKSHPQKQWELFLVSNVSQDTDLLCHFTCEQEQQSKSLRVRVYQLPTQVKLRLQPPRVVVGKPFTIECRALAVKPLESLTLTLLRGKETLQNQTFGGAALAPQDATTTLNSTASTEDGLLNFSCQAELDLRPHGGYIIRSISEPQILEVYGLPGQDIQMIILITVVSVLLFLFVTSVLLCFVFGQHWHRTRTGTYRVLAAWRRLPRAFRTHPA